MKNLNLLLVLAFLFVNTSCTTSYLVTKVDKYIYKTTKEINSTTVQDFRLRLDRASINYTIYPDSSIYLVREGAIYLKKEHKKLIAVKYDLEKVDERKVSYAYTLLIIPGKITKYYILDYKVVHRHKNYQKEIDSLCLEKFKSNISKFHESLIKQKEYLD